MMIPPLFPFLRSRLLVAEPALPRSVQRRILVDLDFPCSLRSGKDGPLFFSFPASSICRVDRPRDFVRRRLPHAPFRFCPCPFLSLSPLNSRHHRGPLPLLAYPRLSPSRRLEPPHFFSCAEDSRFPSFRTGAVPVASPSRYRRSSMPRASPPLFFLRPIRDPPALPFSLPPFFSIREPDRLLPSGHPDLGCSEAPLTKPRT